jgi:2-polyprenyl-6-methoxyphenol hydroxylase-like FAD-dependent oxidoreductase
VTTQRKKKAIHSQKTNSVARPKAYVLIFSRDDRHGMYSTSSSPPSVVVVGGGPGGLLAAILLGRRNVPTTVIEKAAKPDEWSTKSYSMVIGARGQAALKEAGAIESARNRGMARRCVIIYDTSGNRKVIPREHQDSLGFSRPLLVECLEEITSHQPTVTIRRGLGVTGVVARASSDDGMLEVALDDGGSCVRATHVIGADGKWSAVRASFPELDSQATIKTEPSFGVHMMAPVGTGRMEDGWNERDQTIRGMHVLHNRRTNPDRGAVHFHGLLR